MTFVGALELAAIVAIIALISMFVEGKLYFDFGGYTPKQAWRILKWNINDAIDDFLNNR